MSGRALLATGLLIVGTLAAAPAGACGSDDRFPCGASAASSDTQSSNQAAAAPKAAGPKSQRSAKVRGQKKRLAVKKTTRNAARARILEPSRTVSHTAPAKRVDETPRVQAKMRLDTDGKAEIVKRSDPAPAPAPEPTPRADKSITETPTPRHDLASAGPAPLMFVPALPGSELLSPVPTAGATEMIRLAAPAEAPEPDQISNVAPMVAASEAPTVEFKSDPARLFSTPAVASERISPRKNSPNGLSWMQAVLLALGGGIVAVSTFKLFSISKTAA